MRSLHRNKKIVLLNLSNLLCDYLQELPNGDSPRHE